MDAATYLKVVGFPEVLLNKGGQELLLFDILSEILPVNPKGVWIPFISSGTLTNTLRNNGIYVSNMKPVMSGKAPLECDVLYFGTPTILGDRPLFLTDVSVFKAEAWTKNFERQLVRYLCKIAQAANYKLIVSGLGSGDISTDERIKDMSGGKIICYKNFGQFEDWIISKHI